MQDPAPQASVVQFGRFQLDLRSGDLRGNGKKIRLAGQPFRVLAALLQHPGELVTREELKQKLWPDETFVDFDHSLNTAVKKLRLALGDDAETPRYIETLPRRGYRFIFPLQTLGRVAAPGRSATLTWGAAAAVCVLALLAGYFGWQRVVSPPGRPPERVRLAVLPFENLSGNPEQEYFSDGLTEEMITQLGRLQPERLGVIARTSTMQYKGTRKRADEIGRELGVDYILEGSVRRVDNRVRVSAQLIRVTDQTHLWAENYERELHDILVLQDDVARSIADQIQLKLTPREQTVLDPTGPVKPEAYELYLKGRYFWNKRTEEGFQKAIEHFEQAIQEDPDYALPYAGLADTYVLLGYYGNLPPRQAYPKAEAAARKALEMDETLGEAHSSLAGVFMDYRWDWPEVEREYKRALELNPGYAVAHQWYGNYLNAMGRSTEGIAEIRRARESDPLSLIINTNLGWAYHLARQDDKALEEAHRALALDPNFYWTHVLLGRVYGQKGFHEEAIAAFQKASLLSGNNAMVLAELGHAYAAAGRQTEAQGILARLKRPRGREYVSPYDIALVYVGLGQEDEALAWLEQCYQERSRPLGFAKVEPRLDPLRSDPRFQALLRRMNLAK